MLITFIITLVVLGYVTDYSGTAIIEDGVITVLLATIITVVITVVTAGLGALVGAVS